MRHLSRCLAVMTALALVLVSAAPAQGRPQTREGFWIGFGFGYGSFSLKCSSCSGSDGGFSGYLKLGGTLSPKLLLGGETNGWTKSEGGGTLTAGNASAIMYFYPAPASGFFLRGGLGFASLTASSGGISASESGFGFTVGTGYDIRVGTKMSVVPVANFNWGDLGSGVNRTFSRSPWA